MEVGQGDKHHEEHVQLQIIKRSYDEQQKFKWQKTSNKWSFGSPNELAIILFAANSQLQAFNSMIDHLVLAAKFYD